MAAVKGSKQYRMMVVPRRPLRRVTVAMSFLAIAGALGWAAYQFGAVREVDAARERDELKASLADARQQLQEMRRLVTDLEAGHGIQTLREQIARQDEEISFYKSVMFPGVASKGLRIAGLEMTPGGDAGRVKYSVLLTQAVDKQDYVQGDVEILVLGKSGDESKRFSLSELDKEKRNAIPFKFRYFLDIDGEMLIPDGFVPQEVMVVARSSGSDAQKLEKRFDWPLGRG